MKRRARKTRTVVRIIPPHQPEARDEGPRLLPLNEEQRGESRLDHYITLRLRILRWEFRPMKNSRPMKNPQDGQRDVEALPSRKLGCSGLLRNDRIEE